MDAKDDVRRIIDALHEKNPGEKVHSQRITSICLQIGGALQLLPEDLAKLGRAAYVHDIGKVLMEDTGLKRSVPLTPEQWDEKREHPQVGYDLLAAYGEPQEILEAALHHHENWNGTGYPDRLEGAGIPLFARIIAVAEYADALTMHSERLADVDDNVAGRMREQAGMRLDPILVEKYLSANMR
ncbi:MAG: HD domain-containing protein [Clostridia bacterium]|nr:HD domain-containing protein [Clostridia bacterium]